MRRKTDHLETALATMAANPPKWQPAPPSQFEDDYDVLAQQFFQIVLEQTTLPASAALSQYRSGEMIAENMAEEAEMQEPLPDVVMDEPPVYSTKWVRVPDDVFTQYAPLAQRRPA